MRDLSLHILDILTNSIAADAKLMHISVIIQEDSDLLRVIVEDDGVGMDEDFLKKVADPFSTTRTTRKVGLGIPLLKELCELTGGYFKIESIKGKGTRVEAAFVNSSIDRLPIGCIGDSMAPVWSTYDDRDFVLLFSSQRSGESTIDTREIKQQLDGLSLSHPDVYMFIKDYINEQQHSILGG